MREIASVPTQCTLGFRLTRTGGWLSCFERPVNKRKDFTSFSEAETSSFVKFCHRACVDRAMSSHGGYRTVRYVQLTYLVGKLTFLY